MEIERYVTYEELEEIKLLLLAITTTISKSEGRDINAIHEKLVELEETLKILIDGIPEKESIIDWITKFVKDVVKQFSKTLADEIARYIASRLTNYSRSIFGNEEILRIVSQPIWSRLDALKRALINYIIMHETGVPQAMAAMTSGAGKEMNPDDFIIHENYLDELKTKSYYEGLQDYVGQFLELFDEAEILEKIDEIVELYNKGEYKFGKYGEVPLIVPTIERNITLMKNAINSLQDRSFQINEQEFTWVESSGLLQSWKDYDKSQRVLTWESNLNYTDFSNNSTILPWTFSKYNDYHPKPDGVGRIINVSHVTKMELDYSGPRPELQKPDDVYTFFCYTPDDSKRQIEDHMKFVQRANMLPLLFMNMWPKRGMDEIKELVDSIYTILYQSCRLFTEDYGYFNELIEGLLKPAAEPYVMRKWKEMYIYNDKEELVPQRVKTKKEGDDYVHVVKAVFNLEGKYRDKDTDDIINKKIDITVIIQTGFTFKCNYNDSKELKVDDMNLNLTSYKFGKYGIWQQINQNQNAELAQTEMSPVLYNTNGDNWKTLNDGCYNYWKTNVKLSDWKQGNIKSCEYYSIRGIDLTPDTMQLDLSELSFNVSSSEIHTIYVNDMQCSIEFGLYVVYEENIKGTFKDKTYIIRRKIDTNTMNVRMFKICDIKGSSTDGSIINDGTETKVSFKFDGKSDKTKFSIEWKKDFKLTGMLLHENHAVKLTHPKEYEFGENEDNPYKPPYKYWYPAHWGCTFAMSQEGLNKERFYIGPWSNTATTLQFEDKWYDTDGIVNLDVGVNNVGTRMHEQTYMQLQALSYHVKTLDQPKDFKHIPGFDVTTLPTLIESINKLKEIVIDTRDQVASIENRLKLLSEFVDSVYSSLMKQSDRNRNTMNTVFSFVSAAVSLFNPTFGMIMQVAVMVSDAAITGDLNEAAQSLNVAAVGLHYIGRYVMYKSFQRMRTESTYDRMMKNDHVKNIRFNPDETTPKERVVNIPTADTVESDEWFDAYEEMNVGEDIEMKTYITNEAQNELILKPRETNIGMKDEISERVAAVWKQIDPIEQRYGIKQHVAEDSHYRYILKTQGISVVEKPLMRDGRPVQAMIYKGLGGGKVAKSIFKFFRKGTVVVERESLVYRDYYEEGPADNKKLVMELATNDVIDGLAGTHIAGTERAFTCKYKYSEIMKLFSPMSESLNWLSEDEAKERLLNKGFSRLRINYMEQRPSSSNSYLFRRTLGDLILAEADRYTTRMNVKTAYPPGYGSKFLLTHTLLPENNYKIKPMSMREVSNHFVDLMTGENIKLPWVSDVHAFDLGSLIFSGTADNMTFKDIMRELGHTK